MIAGVSAPHVEMTIAEKILARASGRSHVRPAEYVWARADSAVVCDLGWTLVGPPIAELGARVVEPERVVVTFDHAVPAETPSSAELHRKWRAFCAEHGLERLHDVGDQGITHVLSVQRGYARPGTLQVSVDTDANTCGAVGCLATAMGWTSWPTGAGGALVRRAPKRPCPPCRRPAARGDDA
jgi:3-isopropylmalate/(R)-2-methylmalate dehydratase large subunit